jgi:N-acetyl-1-D-myo-inositol-2-amino-2-deoxy-alpha-D-glucopyranoside deacetylase/mycothiol S-conjugate amidase
MAGAPENNHPRALAAQPVEEVADRIARCLQEIQPQVVITHDPIGGYKHPDHIAVHNATVKAFYDLVDSPPTDDDPAPYRPQKLYFTTFPRLFLQLAVRIAPLFGRNPRKWGKNKDIDMVDLLEESDFPTHARIKYRSVIDRKEAATACHASQLDGGPPTGGLLRWIFRLFTSEDRYMRAYPPAEPGLREDDLFAGVQ